MADLSKLKLPDNTEYNIKDTVARAKGSIYYGTCTTAAGTKDKVATVSSDQNFVLQVGSMVAVKFSNTNSYSATASNHITLNVNSTGAFDIWYSNTNATTGTQTAAFGIANNYHYYMYDGTYWIFAGRSLDGDSGNTNLRYNGAIKAGTSDIVAGNLICANNSNLYYHLKKGTAFDIRWPIMYANSNITANSTGTNNYMFINFNVNTTQSMTLTAYSPVYIKGTLSGTTFTPISTAPLTQTAPSDVDNYHYILLGIATSTTHLYLLEHHPIYKYSDGAFKIYEQTFAVNNNITNGAAVDLNTIKTPGFYNCGGANSASPVPSGLSGSAFGLEVIKDALGEYYTQIYYPLTSNVTYIRYCNNGTWSDWTDYIGRVKQTATSTDANYEVLFSNSANNTTETAGTRKDSGLTFNPSTDTLTTKYVNPKVTKAMTGTGTAGSDAGSGTSPRYTPSKWTFNSSITVANGEIYFIQIPVAGGTYGVWLSLNNGTNYYPVAVSSGKNRFTTHYGKNTVIAVTYESAGVCSCYALAGADAVADVTGCFRVLNDYDSGNTNTNVTQTATTTNANYEVLFSVTADNTTRTEGARKNSNLKFNPSTGNLQTTQINGVTVGSNPKFTDNDRYVNSAAFADDTTNTAASPVKMTLTRAGSDTSTVTANIPKVSSSSAGVVPKGAAVTSQSNTTKFLREDGTWAVPSYLQLGTSSTTALKGDTKYAGSSSAGGAATSANKINTDGGSMLNPVYFSGGVPVASSGNSIPFIVGTGSTAGTWLGTLEGLTAYYDGLMILYKPSVAGASTTTLNINNLGAKTCYINNTTKLTTHFPANQPILLFYSSSQNSGCWMSANNYWTDSNTYDRTRINAAIKCGSTAIVAKNIIVADNTGNYKHLKLGTAFDITYPILYAPDAIAANATGTNNYSIINLTVTTTQSITLTAYKAVYIKGTLSGTTFTPVSTAPLTQTVPEAVDNYQYILVGIATSTTAFYLMEDHPIFEYRNGEFGLYEKDAKTVNGHTVLSDVPANAVYTDRYVNSAAFADDTSNNTNSPVKMTLTRAGSDSTAVTANIPKVSSTSAGVAPKGTAVSTQSQNTKFLREDGTWAKPSYTTNTNTTYTFAEGSVNGKFSVTPSGGSAQSVTVHGLNDLAYKNKIDTSYMEPLYTNTYTGLIGSDNTAAGASFYFGTIIPTSYTGIWKIHYRIYAEAAGRTDAKSWHDCWAEGNRSSVRTYANYNTIVDTSYNPLRWTLVYRATEAGITSNYGHLLGVGLRDSWARTTAANSRTIKVEIIETIDCTYTPWNTAVKYANVPGTGSTNYSGLSELDAYNNGLRETGDDNTTVHNRINYFAGKTGATGVYAYTLFMEDGNGTYQSIVTSSTTGTKTVNSHGFKVGSPLWYSNTTYAANTNISGQTVVYSAISTVDSRYAFNVGLTAGALTTYKPIYLVGTINGSDGLFYLDSTWWTQTPNDSSKIYILVGGVYASSTSSQQYALYEQNPWYRYEGGQFKKLCYGYLKDTGGTLWGNLSMNGNIYMNDKNIVNAKKISLDNPYSSGGVIPTSDGTSIESYSFEQPISGRWLNHILPGDAANGGSWSIKYHTLSQETPSGGNPIANFTSQANGSPIISTGEKGIIKVVTTNSQSIAINHNNIYRGEELLSSSHFGTGSTGLTAIHNAVSSGDFSDIYIGDTITVTMAAISGYESAAQTVEWVVMGIDLYYPAKIFAASTSTTKSAHYLVLVPKNAFNTTNVMNDTATTTTGYYGSKMKSTILEAYKPAVQASLGGSNNLLQICLLSSTASSDDRINGGTGLSGAASSGTLWSSKFLQLLNEVEIFGTKIASGTNYDAGFPNTQLPGFRLNPSLIVKKANGATTSWWTLGINSTTKFVSVNSVAGLYEDLPLPGGKNADSLCGIVPSVYFG